MPAGGTWIAQNKRRPGAYINFVSVPKTVGILGERGTVAAGIPMSWGAEGQLIELTGQELLDGSSVAKIGVDYSDTAGSLIYRCILAGCFKAYIYRLDSGGAKATATLGTSDVTVEAKYSGIIGNDLKVVIVVADSKGTVSILLDGVEKEKFTEITAGDATLATDITKIVSNYVTFTPVEGASYTISDLATTGKTLTGGTNGTIVGTALTSMFAALKNKTFQAMAVYGTNAADATALSTQVKVWHEQYGKDVVAVVYDYPAADYEGVISVNQGFKTATETITTSHFPLYVASLTAGAQVNESLTCAVIEGATEIVNPIDEAQIEAALEAGKFILTYRQDGAVCIEQDINSLHEFTVDKNYAFSKNRVVRVLYQLSNDISLIFNRNYAGKADNDDIGRNLFKMEIIALIDTLTGLGAITNFDGAKDITVLKGQSVDSVVVDLTIQPVDAMEKLYMTINVNA